MTGKRHVTAAEAGRRLEVATSTVARWADAGKIPGAYRTVGGHWRIPATWVAEQMKGKPA